MIEENILIEKINQMAIDIAQIKTTLEMLPPAPKQPCQWHDQVRKEFDGHIAEHRQLGSNWHNALISGAVELLKTAIIAGAAVILGSAFSGGA